MEKSRCISCWTLQSAAVRMFSVRTADESAGSELCWFWQTEYIQYNRSAVFSSYVTSVSSRGRTNIKPQDPGEPKEPFSLVRPPPSPPPPVFFWVSFSWTTPILLSLPSPYYSFTPPSSSLAYILSLSSLSLSSLCYLPSLFFSLSLIMRPPKSAISFPEHHLLPQNSHSRSVYSIIPACLTPPPCTDGHAPPETHTTNVIDRTDRSSPFHSPALPIPLFHINVLTVPQSRSISQPKDL